MAKTVSLTREHATTLLGSAFKLQEWPKAIGEGDGAVKFIPAQCNQIANEIGALVVVMKKQAPLFKKKYALFGPLDIYERKERKPTEEELAVGADPETLIVYYAVKKDYDEDRTFDIELGPSAQKGAFWIAYAWLAHGSPAKLNIGAGVEIAWALVDQLGARPAMEKRLGLTDSNSALEVKFDEPAAVESRP